ncbi:MAG TPA: hypothetical protein VFB38_18595 [Chthonomonadaceae bacterium]|nr:hypothetical protein [Chthonomonadaceae bacterium]
MPLPRLTTSIYVLLLLGLSTLLTACAQKGERAAPRLHLARQMQPPIISQALPLERDLPATRPRSSEPQSPTKQAASETEKPRRSSLPEQKDLPADRAAIAQLARQLQQQMHAGRLTLTVAWREGAQLRRLERDGAYPWPPPPPMPSARRSEPAVPAVPLPNIGTVPSVFPPDPFRLETSNSTASRSTARVLSARGASLEPRAMPDGNPAEILNAESQAAPPPPTTPSPRLMRTLLALAARSTPRRPLEVLSLLRAPYPTPTHPRSSPRNPHARGIAADIAAYAGHRITQSHPEECVAMTLALLRDLPPGYYRIGMPKAPETPAVAGRPPLEPDLQELLDGLTASLSDGAALKASPWNALAVGAAVGIHLGKPRRPWPFFPPQEFEIADGVVAPLLHDGQIVRDAEGHPLPHILRFRNESYAPASALADTRLRKALEAARKRGVMIYALFPDAADHVHIDVRPPSN